jgi:uncharacterized protein YndB with AHSA1/START domain
VIAGLEAAPVRKSIMVHTPARDAFEVFTEEVDSWWPRTHHIGKTPMVSVTIEPRMGGTCYTRHEDGSVAIWGHVLAWEPPTRLVLAWQLTHNFGHQPDIAQASEVEVRFTPVAPGSTRVDLEHRLLERHGAGAAAMRQAVDAPNGWTAILDLYCHRAEQPHTEP